MTDWDPSAVAAVLRTESRFPGGSVVGVLAVGHSQTRIWVLESEPVEAEGEDPAGAVAGSPVILAERRLDDVGTDLFDALLLDRVAGRIADLPGADEELAQRLRRPEGEPWIGLRAHLVGEVRRAREELSAWHSSTIDVDQIPGISPDGPLRLDRIELDNALRPHVLRLAREFGATIEESGRRPSLLDGVHLLGGGQIPLIVRSVYDVLGVSPTVVGRDDLVAAGARARATPPSGQPVHNGSTRPGGVPSQARTFAPAEGLMLQPSTRTPNRARATGTDRSDADRNGADRGVADRGVADRGVVGRNGAGGQTASAPAEREPRTELTDTGSLRLLRDDEDGFDEGGLDGSAGPTPHRRGRLLVPLLGGIAVLAALAVIGVTLVHNGTVPGLDSTDPVSSDLGPATTVQPTATTAAALLPAAQELSAARVGGIAIRVSWDEVEGARRYALYRDAGTADEKVRTTITTELTDRPGDGRTHEYTVVAIDAAGTEGESSQAVTAKAATPYGKLQEIASAWTGIVPIRPGREGSAGQTCTARPARNAKQVDRIVCTYPKNLTVTVFDHVDADGTDERYEKLSSAKGVTADTWKVELQDDVQDSGRTLAGGTKSSRWLWWDYTSAPSYAIQARWPGRSAAKLSAWVQQRLPFHT